MEADWKQISNLVMQSLHVISLVSMNNKVLNLTGN